MMKILALLIVCLQAGLVSSYLNYVFLLTGLLYEW